MKARFLAVFLAAAVAAVAGDAEFDHVVKAIESHYGTKRMHVPFLGLASFAVKVAHPAGASEFKLAIFENLDADPFELNHFMNDLASPTLHPLVRVRSRQDQQASYIYAGEIGKSTRMLIATFQRNEATLIEVKVDMDTLLKWINNPEDAGKSHGPKHEW
jgi:hypothetical protein